MRFFDGGGARRRVGHVTSTWTKATEAILAIFYPSRLAGSQPTFVFAEVGGCRLFWWVAKTYPEINR